MPPAASANSIRMGPDGLPVSQQDIARRRAQYAYHAQMRAESMMRMQATLGSLGRGGPRPTGPYAMPTPDPGKVPPPYERQALMPMTPQQPPMLGEPPTLPPSPAAMPRRSY